MTIYSPLASPKATIDKLTEQGLHTRKSLGQHFLIDDGVVGRILRTAALRTSDLVLEIGPGIGTLTEALLGAGASVIAIEKDARLLPTLADIVSRHPHRFTCIHADALSILEDFDTLGINGDKDGSFCPTKVVANLPYSVAATIVLDCFQHLPSLASATVMVQREVAERMMADPGSKDYGAYTIKLRLLAQATANFGVSRASFLPPPRVDSTVIRLDRNPHQPTPKEREALFTVVDAAFAERRKTIRNSMRSYFAARGNDPALVDTLLAAANVPPSVRGETLPLETYQNLARSLTFLIAVGPNPAIQSAGNDSQSLD